MAIFEEKNKLVMKTANRISRKNGSFASQFKDYIFVVNKYGYIVDVEKKPSNAGLIPVALDMLDKDDEVAFINLLIFSYVSYVLECWFQGPLVDE